MQLPLNLKWNQSRNRRSLLGLYAALALVAILCIWSIPKLANSLMFCFAFMLNPGNRLFILEETIWITLAIAGVTATGIGIFAFWHFLTTQVWQIPRHYMRAIERLDDDRIEHRLESIQTLRRIAKLALRKQAIITRPLVDFVQQRASIYARYNARHNSAHNSIALPETQTIAADIQAALTLIGQKPLIFRVMWRFIRRAYREGDKQINMGLTNLSSACLPHADLPKANLYKTNLQKANLQNIDLHQATLQGANLKDCNLRGAVLQAAHLQGCNLQEATLYRTNLQKANLYNANLQGANLYSANLQDASLQDANLQGANLQGANLQGAFLYGTNLQNTKLQSANLREAFLPEANLQGANLQGANLQDVTGLADEQLKQAKLCMTVLPDGSISDRDCAELGVCPRPRLVKPAQKAIPPQPSPC